MTTDGLNPHGRHFLMHDEKAGAWRVWENPVRTSTAWQLSQVGDVLAASEQARRDGLWSFGFLCYEAGAYFDSAFPRRPTLAGLPYAQFFFFPESAMQVVSCLPDHPTGDSCEVGEWLPEIASERYERDICEIRGLIEAGETYQVNYSFRQHAAFAGCPGNLFRNLVAAQGPGLSAYLDLGRMAICSASPELFFRRRGNRIVCRPMKGTASRALYPEADRGRRRWLQSSTKNRAENLMIVDMVRNDLGRIAEPGSVKVDELFRIEKYPSVWQMTSVVSAISSAPLAGVFQALFPSASITGAPKVQTMAIIDRLEQSSRGIYTGTIGFVAPNGDCQFSVAIRTAVVDRELGRVEYGVGGGIVWDSTAADEWDECAAKAALLHRQSPEFALLEALLWTPEDGYWLFDRHLRRLAESADYFGFPFSQDRILAALDHATADACRASKVRLVLGADGEPTVETIALSHTPVSDTPTVALAEAPIDSENVFLYHKTTCRGVYDRARAALPDVDDVILWNERGELTESCSCNLVLDLDGGKVTPPVSCGLLAGVCRAGMLAAGEITEQVLTLADYQRAESVFLINSVRGLRPAHRAD